MCMYIVASRKVRYTYIYIYTLIIFNIYIYIHNIYNTHPILLNIYDEKIIQPWVSRHLQLQGYSTGEADAKDLETSKRQMEKKGIDPIYRL